MNPKKTILCLMNMSHAENTSGVDRYIKVLIQGLKNHSWIKIVWINLISDKNLLFLREEAIAHYIKITIPLPQCNTIIKERFRLRKYNEQIYRMVKHLLEPQGDIIFHLHTLDTIDFALYVRKQMACKIITHQHIIPWKELYNKDRPQYNIRYEKMYLQPIETIEDDINLYMINNCEMEAYTEPDTLISVTHGGADFLKNRVKIDASRITVIPNGMDDHRTTQAHSTQLNVRPRNEFRCLFVGNVCESKGIIYILKALRIVQQTGYSVSLTIAGSCAQPISDKISDYNDLKIEQIGKVSFEELCKHYIKSDIGIIASLHEQASYVAIEMAMFGLPMVVTAVDGLDETFTDEINALKVKINYSKPLGLTVDVQMMARQIIRLINSQDLKFQLSRNTRSLYEEKLDLDTMIEKTVEVYKRVLTH